MRKPTTATTTEMIRPLSMGELSSLYEINPKTMRRWLNRHQSKIGERMGRYYTTLQVRTVFDLIGPPPGVMENDPGGL